MAQLRIRCGFKPISGGEAYFRGSNQDKGRLLYESDHVSNVEEVVSEGNTTVSGKCVAQTSKTVYNVTVNIDSATRTIASAKCPCKAGVIGKCKHAAALVAFVNCCTFHSSTSMPQQWGRPPTSTLDKKRRLSELYPGGTQQGN
ncbi:uncharacterized protein LOC135387835 [Ornithodoros turicata]|uniref:uncharacterized protein LOC135387835 n=1 Tax=Ornithodoros turicata TaxID=34597 RepID=UPI003138B50D